MAHRKEKIMEKRSKSAEDYLESILVVQEKQGYARSVDIAADLSVTKPSVSVAMKKLREKGLILFDGNGHLILTDSGREIAESVYGEHKLLKKVLMDIGVPEETASEEACLIEHVISDETCEKIIGFCKKIHLKAVEGE